MRAYANSLLPAHWIIEKDGEAFLVPAVPNGWSKRTALADVALIASAEKIDLAQLCAIGLPKDHMTPNALKSARHALGLSADGFAKLIQVESGRTVRRWEAGARDIPGPVVVIVGALLESRAVRRYFGVALDGDSTP